MLRVSALIDSMLMHWSESEKGRVKESIDCS